MLNKNLKLSKLFSDLSDKRILITGGCGFIGTNLIEMLLTYTNAKITNIDNLSYASVSNYSNNTGVLPNYKFYQIDLKNKEKIDEVFNIEQPQFVIHCAAESHVDNSISSSSEFIDTNIIGTYHLLESSKDYLKKANVAFKNSFQFLYMSTDEVYGDAEGSENLKFSETSPIRPSSPYAASKAAGDTMVMAWNRTYSIPAIITRCSNNFGPYQNIEKLIPKVVSNSIQGFPIPLYGDGQQIRDWIYVKDHIIAVLTVLINGLDGEIYNISSENCISNTKILTQIQQHISKKYNKNFFDLQKLVFSATDRLGHDRKYALSSEKIRVGLGWKPIFDFTSALNETVEILAEMYEKNILKAS